ncbi:MAG: hypothetical protein GY803_27955 [Chloroflexi bacterium]|nr:hypothetical protein [Chloroflexota bacterium]
MMHSEIWQNRWAALDGAIQGVIDTFPLLEGDPEKDAWQITLKSTLECLKAFGRKQFDFFDNGFKGNKPLVQSPKYKAEYALRNTLDQIAYDVSALQRARNQRSNLATPQERDVLALADKLGYKALLPVIGKRLLRETTVITYFQKAPTVRIVPYAPIALIGIPYTCLDIENNGRDFLSIPHEIGHYIFWHAKIEENGVPLNAWLRSQVPTQPAWRFAWLEEIFADVYGSLIAGPVIVADFQELLYDNLNLDEDDGDHPAAILRPFIYTDTLRQFSNFGFFKKAPDDLDEKWRDKLSERNCKNEFKPKGTSSNAAAITAEKAREQIEQVINTILTALQPIFPQKQDDVWSDDISEPDTLFEQFYDKHLKSDDATKAERTAKVATTTDNLPPTLIVTAPSIIATPNDVPRPLEWQIGDTITQWLDFFNSASDNGLKLLPTTWNALLDGSGWAAGGPEMDSDPK